MNEIAQLSLPPLPTMGVGSYAAPGWFIASWRAARKGEWGAHDIDELFEDATRVVIADQGIGFNVEHNPAGGGNLVATRDAHGITGIV